MWKNSNVQNFLRKELSTTVNKVDSELCFVDMQTNVYHFWFHRFLFHLVTLRFFHLVSVFVGPWSGQKAWEAGPISTYCGFLAFKISLYFSNPKFPGWVTWWNSASILENVINILWLTYVKSRHTGLTFGSKSNWEVLIWVPGSQNIFIVQLVELFTNWKEKRAWI